jgi:hypothetical protein
MPSHCVCTKHLQSCPHTDVVLHVLPIWQQDRSYYLVTLIEGSTTVDGDQMGHVLQWVDISLRPCPLALRLLCWLRFMMAQGVRLVILPIGRGRPVAHRRRNCCTLTCRVPNNRHVEIHLKQICTRNARMIFATSNRRNLRYRSLRSFLYTVTAGFCKSLSIRCGVAPFGISDCCDFTSYIPLWCSAWAGMRRERSLGPQSIPST